MSGFLFNFSFCLLAIYTAKIYFRDRDYFKAAAAIGFAVILATCGVMALEDVY
ncbi:MAG: hypothetical protein WCJ35_17970 [Planctomycetota bacterium]